MFPAYLYKYIYIISVIVLTICVNVLYTTEATRVLIRRRNRYIITLGVALLFAIFIGERPISGQYFIDMAGYVENYRVAFGDYFIFDKYATNFIFDNLFLYLASKAVPVSTFFLLMALLYFLCAFIACKKFFPEDSLIAFLFFLAAFSTFSYSVNGMKAGVAGSLFLIALAYRKKIVLCLVLALVSFGFHHSMELPVISLIVVLLIRNTKFYFAIWVVCLLLAVSHVTFFQDLFAKMTDEQGAGYLVFEMDAHWASVIRFRPDFVLYSSVPIIIGFYLINVRRVESSDYEFMLNIYMLTNSVWMLCMYSTYTNRIAYLSWFMYPIVLVFPFLKERWHANQYQFLKLISYGHLAFTVFMLFVYD